MSNRLLCLLLSASLFAAGAVEAAGNTTIESFNKAKKILEHQVYQDHRITFYCLASFDRDKNITLPEGFVTPEHQKRAKRVEWEHVVPAENFGRFFSEWRDGSPECVDSKGRSFKGRKCAEKASREYRFMRRVEPPEYTRGPIARSTLYMAEAYADVYKLSNQQRQLMEAWNKMYPADQWECTRAQRIQKIQKNENRFVTEACRKAGL